MNTYRMQTNSSLPEIMALIGHKFCSRVVETWRFSLE
jgi:hypothetical protein